jgi:type IV secretion system protein VirB8
MTTDSERPPLSPKAMAAIDEARTWETDRVANAVTSGRRAWIAAAVASVFGVLGMAMATFQSLRPPAAPYPVIVDRTTGETLAVPPLDAANVPALAALDQHNAAVFVRAREAYNLGLLQRDYEQVARMTSPETWAPYGRLFVGERALHTVLADKEEHRIVVISVRLTQTPTVTVPGEAVVTYDKVIQPTTGPTTSARFVATVRYQYRPARMKRAVDRIENPFGYVVIAYRSDQELVSPSPAPSSVSQAGGQS